MITSAIYKLYPSVVRTVGDKAYDAGGNEVAYDFEAVTAEAQVMVKEQVAAKQSALNKLMALGLTVEEALALGK
jgi:hypothetical protein